jgi:AcrR family transcriptional regulator
MAQKIASFAFKTHAIYWAYALAAIALETEQEVRMTTDAPTRTAPAAPGRRRKAGAKPACSPATKELILEVAERMFAERGFASVSIRDLTAEAGVNIASINYYFGSKDRLLFEVYKRRVNEMTEARTSLLRAAEARTGGKPTSRDVLHALLAPAMHWRDPASGRTSAIKFLVRARSEGTPQIKKMIDTRLGALPEFRDALLRAQPELSFEDVCWGLHFALSTMHHVGIEMDRLATLSDGKCDASDTEALITRLVEYTSAGFIEGGRAKKVAKAG